ncbi:MAG: hypothetical protein J2P17_00110 [Mycobacterium sp.]|nr:hypothetical protein [Mycobacterium sp.]
MNSRHRDEQTTDREPADQPGLGRVLAATFLCLITVAGGVTFAATRNDRPAAPTTSGTSSPLPTTTRVAPGITDGFGVPAADVFGRRVDIPVDPAGTIIAARPDLQRKPSDLDWLTAPPAGLCDHRTGHAECAPGGWQKIHGAVVPMSSSDGPTRLDHGIAAGYAHTPQGAALAAAYTIYEIAARPGDRKLRDERAVLTADDQHNFDTAAAAGQLPMQLAELYTQWMLAVDAFRIDSYAPDYAVVSLAARAPGDTEPTWSAVAVPMVWRDGDWRVRGTGQQLPTSTIHDLAGWTSW